MFVWIFRWPRYAAIAAGVALALFAYGAWSTWVIMTAQPNPTIDYIAKLNELTLEEQPEGEDAWPIYREIIANDLGFELQVFAGNRNFDAMKKILHSQIWYGDWSDSRHGQAKSELIRVYPILGILERAANCDYFAIPFTDSFSDPNRPEGGLVVRQGRGVSHASVTHPIRVLAAANTAAVRAALEAGDYPDAYAKIDAGLFLIEQLRAQPSLTSHLSANSLAELLADELSSHLNEKEMPRGFIAQIDTRLALSIDRLLLTRASWLAGEALVRHDMRQWTYASARENALALREDIAGVRAKPVAALHLGGNLGGLFVPSYGDAGRAIDAWQSLLVRLMESKPSDIPLFRPELERLIHNVPPLAFDNWAFYQRVAGQQLAPISRLHGIRIMLQLEAYHQSHGEWPAALSEAISDEFARDPVSDLPFIYISPPIPPDERPFELHMPWAPRNRVQPIVNPNRKPISSPAGAQ